MSALDRRHILIVGGGPAGLSTALHLARLSPSLASSTLLVEARDYPRPKICGGGVTAHGEEQLERLGLQHLGVPEFSIDRLLFQLGQQTFDIARANIMRVIQRAEFDAAIARAAAGCGVDVHTGERVERIEPAHDGFIVTTNRQRYHAAVLVAADGAASTVRHKLGFHSAVGVARLLRVMTPLAPADEHIWENKTAVFDFSCVRDGIQGYTWDFPCWVDGEPYINRGIFDSRLFPGADRPHGQLKRTFTKGLQERGVNPDAVQLQGHPVRWFNPHAEFARPHVLLVGDAAGVDPLFAEGISYGMEYGEIAAQALVDAFCEGDLSFADYPARLLGHRLGRLLRRRTVVARALYRHALPPLWGIVWTLAGVASERMQNNIGEALALL
ncbi:MAG: NAD(P)/FAD-dependent oxidoreductase [Anaerolineae bacterium]